jgi:hypothetical protein
MRGRKQRAPVARRARGLLAHCLVIGSANYYNLSAKADKYQSGEALHLVQIIDPVNYYNTNFGAKKDV